MTLCAALSSIVLAVTLEYLLTRSFDKLKANDSSDSISMVSGRSHWCLNQ